MGSRPGLRVRGPGVLGHEAGAEVAPGHRGYAPAPDDAGAPTIGIVHAAHKLFEGCLLLELLDDGVQGLGSLLVVSLVVAHHGAFGSTRIHGRGSHKT